MGCNASQEPTIALNENGSATIVDGDDNQGTDDGGQQQQQQQLKSNDPEPEISMATNNDNNSPGSKPMTPQQLKQLVTRDNREGFIGDKNTPEIKQALEGEEEDEEEEERSELIQSRAQSSTTKSVSSAASSTGRSSSNAAKNLAALEMKEEDNNKSSNGETVCLENGSDGATDLANNLANSITETNASGDSSSGNPAIEAEFGKDEGNIERNGFFDMFGGFRYTLLRHYIRMDGHRKVMWATISILVAGIFQY